VTDAERDELIERLEKDARQDPGSYRRRVVVLAVLGYAFLGAVLIGATSLAALVLYLGASGKGGFLVIKLGLPLLGLAFVVVRGMWVRFEAPRGILLERGSFPVLETEVEKIREALNAPSFDAILVTPQINAAVSQVPRLGVFGWPRNYLILGLPLLDGLTPAEARAVLAHELGHLSAADGSLGGWIYRTRAAWHRLMEQLRREERLGAGLLIRFFNWYAPYFDAYSFVAARAQERAADAWGERLVGGRALADALIRLPLLGEVLGERFWLGVFADVPRSVRPERRPFVEMASWLAIPGNTQPSPGVLELALLRTTSHDDTHPSLKERLESLGEDPRIPPAVERSASVEFFEGRRDELAARLDEAWLAEIRDAWKARFEECEKARARLAALDLAASTRTVTSAEALKRASLREELEGADAALPLYRAMMDGDTSHHAQARFAVARILIGRGSAEGMDLLRPFFEGPLEAVAPARRLAAAFVAGRGEVKEAADHLRAAEAWEAKVAAAQSEWRE